jgi:hypothetical protein
VATETSARSAASGMDGWRQPRPFLGLLPLVSASERRRWQPGAIRQCESHFVVQLLDDVVGAVRQLPVGAYKVAGVAVGILLEVILVFGFSLPERPRWGDLRHDMAGP